MPKRTEVMNGRLDAWFRSNSLEALGVATPGHRSMLLTAYSRALERVSDPKWASIFGETASVATLGKWDPVHSGEIEDALCRIVDALAPLVVRAHSVYSSGASDRPSYRNRVRSDVEEGLGRRLTSEEWSNEEQTSRERLVWAITDAYFDQDPESAQSTPTSEVVGRALSYATDHSVATILAKFSGADAQLALAEDPFLEAIERARRAFKACAPSSVYPDITPEELRREAAAFAESKGTPALTGDHLARFACTRHTDAWLQLRQPHSATSGTDADLGRLDASLYAGYRRDVETEPFLQITRWSVRRHIRMEDLPDVVFGDPSVEAFKGSLSEADALFHDVLTLCWERVNAKLTVDYVLNQHPLGPDPAQRPPSFINYWTSLQKGACKNVKESRWKGHGGRGLVPLPTPGDSPDPFAELTAPEDGPVSSGSAGDDARPDRQYEEIEGLESWAYQFGSELADLVPLVADEEGLVAGRRPVLQATAIAAAATWFREELPRRVVDFIEVAESPKSEPDSQPMSGSRARGPRFGKSVATSCRADLLARGIEPATARRASLVAQSTWTRRLQESGIGRGGRD